MPAGVVRCGDDIELDRGAYELRRSGRALKLDPFSRIDSTVLGCTYFFARRYDQAKQQFKKAIELNPDFFVTYYHFAWLYSQVGQYQNAISELTKGRLLSGDDRTVKTAASEQVALSKALELTGAKGSRGILARNSGVERETGA